MTSMVTEPFTVGFLDSIRRDTRQGQLQIGQGVNHFPAFPGLLPVLESVLRDVFREHGWQRYGLYRRDEALAALASLVNLYLGADLVTADDLIVTNGSTEAVSLLCEHAAHSRWSALFPLPAYFCYELSAAKMRLPIRGYYNHAGEVTRVDGERRPVVHFANSPDAITGAYRSWEQVRSVATDADLEVALTVCDLVYQMQDFDGGVQARTLAEAAARAGRLEDVALLMTTSKDLSLPGIRAGLLISRNRGLLKQARASVTERYFSVNPLCVYLCLLYLLLVLLHGAPRAGDKRRLLDSVKSQLSRTGDWPGMIDASWVTAFDAHIGAMVGQFRDNLQIPDADYPELFARSRSIEPRAGYSALMTLPFRNPGPAAIAELARHLARVHELKINPSYAFSGTPGTWEALYPDEIHLRINVSANDAQLRRQLALLQRGTREITRSDPRWTWTQAP
jgi:histidinol-phosphate/aromatic aminotransferase/cobyric acid decarboxylase-like protein